VDSSVLIYKKLSPLTDYVDWEDNLVVRKDMEKYIDEILSGNNYPEDKIEDLTKKIIDLAVRHLHER